MSQVYDSIEAPYQGVSQAPQPVRLTAQAQDLQDCLVTIPNGCEKRPPFSHIKRLTTATDWRTDSLFAEIQSDTGEYGLLIQTEGSDRIVHILDMETGDEETVNVTTEAQAYLNAGTPVPNADIRAVTIADTTIIANRKMIVDNVATTAPSRPYEAIVWVRSSAYGRTYSITVQEDGGTARTGTLLTSDGSTQASTAWIDTDVIITTLLDGAAIDATIPDNGAATGDLQDELETDGFTVQQIGSVLYLSNSVDFTVSVTDGQAGSAMIAVKGKAQAFSDLPQQAVDGFVVRITQTSGGDEDDFFVKYVEPDGVGTGVWEETIAPGTNLGVDPETMPIGCVWNNAMSRWDVDVLPWEGRQVGDADLSADPEFIGVGIEDVSFWSGRLVLIYDEGSHLSATDNPYAFYPRTLSTTLDNDPIGHASPFRKKSRFRFAEAFEDRLVISSDLAVLAITKNNALGKPEINVMAQYEFDQALRPSGANNKVYFTAKNGSKASTVWELNIDNVSATSAADPMTLAVPRLLPAGLDRAAINPVNFMIVYGKSGTSTMYAHIFRYSGNERIQNGWFPLNLPTGFSLGGCFFVGTRLYVLAIEAVDGGNDRAHVCVMDITPSLLDADSSAGILTHLDLRGDQDQFTAVYSAGTDSTDITFPYDLTGLTPVISVAAPGGTGGVTWSGALQNLYEGQLADIETISGFTVTVTGDWSNVPYYAGLAYTASWTLSKLYARDSSGTPVRAGRLSVRRAIFDVSDSGYMRFEISVKGRSTRSMTFTGYQYNDSESVYGQAPSITTPFSVGIGAENEQVTIKAVNDTHLPGRITGFEWRGEFNAKAGGL